MHQVLFWIPVKFSWFPDGIPVYAYGAMLFSAFLATVMFSSRRAPRTGVNISRDKIQDLAILLFIAGLAGARLTYMIQFNVPLTKFFRIWEGGIVLYGGIIGGAIAFILYHHFMLKRFKITLWQMADLAAPAVAIGVALGRVGCLLNGCCWGQAAGESCPAIEFPLLPAPSREMLVDKDGVQTVAGFLVERDLEDPRSIVRRIEPGSAADKAGLREGDRILKIKTASEWRLNAEVMIVAGPSDEIAKFRETMKEYGRSEEVDSGAAESTTLKIFVEDPAKFHAAYEQAKSFAAAHQRTALRLDLYTDLLNNWPRGRNSIQFIVDRDGKEFELPAFTPRSIGLHPTQLYEIISMVLLLLLVLAFYPFRQHDGQVFVLWMVAYSFHRFLNEILRTEPVEGLNMTLSQNISVLVLAVAIGLEIYLRQTQPRRTTGAGPA